jgi:hypothetical protein
MLPIKKLTPAPTKRPTEVVKGKGGGANRGLVLFWQPKTEYGEVPAEEA